jgi:hypothetical protein
MIDTWLGLGRILWILFKHLAFFFNFLHVRRFLIIHVSLRYLKILALMIFNFNKTLLCYVLLYKLYSNKLALKKIGNNTMPVW